MGNCCKRFPLCALPIVCASWILFSVFLTFSISIGTNHTNVEDIPYISDTAASTGIPQTYIFAQFINISVILLIIVGTVRFLYVKEVLKDPKIESRKKFLECLNTTAFVFGVFSDLGFSIIACFPTDNMLIIHGCGGALLFLLGVAYCILQSILSCKITSPANKYTKCTKTQITIAALALCFCLIFVIALFFYFFDQQNVSIHLVHKPPIMYITTDNEFTFAIQNSSLRCFSSHNFRFIDMYKQVWSSITYHAPKHSADYKNNDGIAKYMD